MSDTPNFLLSMVVWAPALAIAIVLWMPERTADQRGRIRLVALAAAGFGLFLIVAATYARMTEGSAGGGLNTALVERHSWVQAFPITAGYHLDADGISLPLLLLSTLLFVCALFASWKNEERVRLHTVLVLMLEVGVNGVLSAHDYLLLILFWALQIAPVFLLIAGWGAEGRRRAAARYLAVALTGFALLATAVALMVAVAARAGHPTFDLADVNGQHLESLAPGLAAAAFWLALAAFSLTIAVVPLHRWMIEACSEAGAPAATLLATIVLTLGGYGMIRVLLGAFPQMSHRYSLVIVGVAAAAALWGTIGAVRQDDVRRLVLYGSAGQLAVVVLAVGSASSLALEGAVLLMLAHGLSYGMLVLLSAAVEERGRTRSLAQLGGLAWQAPRLARLWLFAGFAAIGAPLLAGFTAEVLVVTGSFPAHRIATVLVMASTLVTTGVLLLAFQRIFLGPARETWARVKDVTTLELTCLAPLVSGVLFFGVLPRTIMPVITTGITPIVNRLTGGG